MNRRGFTLVELMIVVVIIGLIAAMAIPRFGVAAYKAREKEAELFLNSVYKAQSTYFALRGTYGSTLADLQSVGFDPVHMQFYAIPAAYDLPLCLASLGVWGGRQIDMAGELSAC